jgi:hypothetical protein
MALMLSPAADAVRPGFRSNLKGLRCKPRRPQRSVRLSLARPKDEPLMPHGCAEQTPALNVLVAF